MEPLLKPTRTAIPPVGGVDVSPIVWVGVISFLMKSCWETRFAGVVIEQNHGLRNINVHAVYQTLEAYGDDDDKFSF